MDSYRDDNPIGTWAKKVDLFRMELGPRFFHKITSFLFDSLDIASKPTTLLDIDLCDCRTLKPS